MYTTPTTLFQKNSLFMPIPLVENSKKVMKTVCSMFCGLSRGWWFWKENISLFVRCFFNNAASATNKIPFTCASFHTAMGRCTARSDPHHIGTITTGGESIEIIYPSKSCTITPQKHSLKSPEGLLCKEMKVLRTEQYSEQKNVPVNSD